MEQLDKEIIEAFQSEATELLKELKVVVEQIEDSGEVFPKALLEEFANKTDRLMGTAKTFEAMCPGHKVFFQIGKFCELCKATGYKASTLNHIQLIPIFSAFWADTLDMLEELCNNIETAEKVEEVTRSFAPMLQKRLIWLAQQIVSLTKGANADQAIINVDGLLKKMGIDV